MVSGFLEWQADHRTSDSRSSDSNKALVGVTVRVVGIDIAEHGEELTARCQRAEVVQDLRLSDLVFPPDVAAAWIHAAYRRCLGLGAHPTTMPPGWRPSWL